MRQKMVEVEAKMGRLGQLERSGREERGPFAGMQ